MDWELLLWTVGTLALIFCCIMAIVFGGFGLMNLIWKWKDEQNNDG